MMSQDSFFNILLFVGIVCGLLCVLAAIFLFAKRVSRGTTEIEFLGFGKIKTTGPALAFAFLGAFLFLSAALLYNRTKTADELRSHQDALMMKTSRDLWKEFHAVTDGRQPPLNPEVFSRVNLLIGVLRELDSENGHALYFAGEVNRWEGLPDPDQNSFYKYIEVFDSLPEKERGADIGSEICYERPHGYCRQRSGWIHHLLGNDFYHKGVAQNEPGQKLFWFRKALEQAKAAKRDFPPNGFVQPVPTALLETQLTNDIAGLEGASAKAP